MALWILASHGPGNLDDGSIVHGGETSRLGVAITSPFESKQTVAILLWESVISEKASHEIRVHQLLVFIIYNNQ